MRKRQTTLFEAQRQFFSCNLILVQSCSNFTEFYLVQGSTFVVWVYLQHKHKFRISCEAYFLNIIFPINNEFIGRRAEEMYDHSFLKKYLHTVKALKKWPAESLEILLAKVGARKHVS